MWPRTGSSSKLWLLVFWVIAVFVTVNVLRSRSLLRSQIITTEEMLSERETLDDIANATLGVCHPSTLMMRRSSHRSQFQGIFVLNLRSRSDRRDGMALAAAYTGLDIEYVDGVSSVDHKSLPPGAAERGLNPGSLFAWRAHIDVLRL